LAASLGYMRPNLKKKKKSSKSSCNYEKYLADIK
jgi:hypothetical protein